MSHTRYKQNTEVEQDKEGHWWSRASAWGESWLAQEEVVTANEWRKTLTVLKSSDPCSVERWPEKRAVELQTKIMNQIAQGKFRS